METRVNWMPNPLIYVGTTNPTYKLISESLLISYIHLASWSLHRFLYLNNRPSRPENTCWFIQSNLSNGLRLHQSEPELNQWMCVDEEDTVLVLRVWRKKAGWELRTINRQWLIMRYSQVYYITIHTPLHQSPVSDQLCYSIKSCVHQCAQSVLCIDGAYHAV